MDKLQANTTIISACLCVEPGKLWRWSRDHLSGFCGKAEFEERYAHDIEAEKEDLTTTVRVPVLKPGNIGPNIAIDEKQIGDEMHTPLTNRDTGKLAMVACTTVAGEFYMAYRVSGKSVILLCPNLGHVSFLCKIWQHSLPSCKPYCR